MAKEGLVLEANHVTIRFGGLTAVSDFNLEIKPGDLVGLIGPNGAGKTTVFNMLTGVYKPTDGEIFVNEQPTEHLKPYEITSAGKADKGRTGFARTFQNIRLFKELSVLDNVKIGGHTHYQYSTAAAVLHTKRFELAEEAAEREAIDLLTIFGLQDRARDTAKSLPYGDQRRLEIARALASRPKLLLLDEPAPGLNDSETHDLLHTILDIHSRFEGIAILVIEHNMELMMELCKERIVVLNFGITIASGTAEQVRANPKVIEAYLGEPQESVEILPTEKHEIRSESQPVLTVSGLEVSYGNVTALHGINLDVKKGEIVTLIGANGAGKTTTLRTISGLLKPRKGEVSYDRNIVGDKQDIINITGDKPHHITAMGVSHVPEGRGIFANLTVHDNLELGAYLRKDKVTQSEYDRIFELFPVLKERIKQNAGTLSGGEQQMLAISRALMAKPNVLLLDEPSLGLAPQMVQTIFRVIKEINAEGTTILLVEQNAHMALMTAHRGYVMETGRIVLSGDASQLLTDERIKKAYLGG